MARQTVTVSLTEVPQFRVLVDFLNAADEHATHECDVALQALVRECRDTLLALRPS